MQNDKNIKNSRRSEGSILVVIMLIVCILFTTGTGIMHLSGNNYIMSINSENYQSCYYAAESILYHAIYVMQTEMESLYESPIINASEFFNKYEARILNSRIKCPQFQITSIKTSINVSRVNTINNARNYKIYCTAKIGKIIRKIQATVAVCWYIDNVLSDDHPFLNNASILASNELVIGNQLFTDGNIYCHSTQVQGSIQAKSLKTVLDGSLTQTALNGYINDFRNNDTFDNYLDIGNGCINFYDQYDIISSDNGGIIGSIDEPIAFITPSSYGKKVCISEDVKEIYGILCVDSDIEFIGEETLVYGAIIVNGDVLLNNMINSTLGIYYDLPIIMQLINDPKYSAFFNYKPNVNGDTQRFKILNIEAL